MPIAARTIQTQDIPGGEEVYATFHCTDDKGRFWYRGRARFASAAAAQTAVDNFDWTPQLRKRDFADLLAFVEVFPGGVENQPSDFDFTNRDVTLLEGEEHLLVVFATGPGEEAIKLAWWLASSNMNPPTFNAIRDRVGIDSITGSEIRIRANELNANLNFNDVKDVGT